MPGGRPSKYKEEYCEQATKLCLLGATDKELADFFIVDEDTINEWKKQHKEFSESLKEGKDMADAKVAQSLYKRATGYTGPDLDIRVIDGQLIMTPIEKHYPPDTTACIFWLKNRQKSKWRDIPKETEDDRLPESIEVAVYNTAPPLASNESEIVK